MQESILYETWQNLATSGIEITCNSHCLKVIQPGILNQARGPDFQTARFNLDGVVYQGDVECHYTSNDWYHHQHHLDQAFTRVILHVIADTSCGTEPVEHKLCTESIPTIVLPIEHLQPSYKHCILEQFPADILQKLGLARFRKKSLFFQHWLQASSSMQIFYESFFRILGYPVNSLPFQMLAQRLPWSWLAPRIKVLNADDLLAVYSGMAGFLSTAYPDAFIQALALRFSKYSHSLDSAELSTDNWQFAALRPLNHPHFRLAGWTQLLQKQRALPFMYLYELFSKRLEFDHLLNEIRFYFKLPCCTYWQTHTYLGHQRNGTQPRVFLGTQRIHEILTNLLLPLFNALARNSGSAGFVEYLEAFYLWLPGQAPYNTLGRQFKGLFEHTQHPLSLALCQGLLYLKKYYCDANRCKNCPVNH